MTMNNQATGRYHDIVVLTHSQDDLLLLSDSLKNQQIVDLNCPYAAEKRAIIVRRLSITVKSRDWYSADVHLLDCGPAMYLTPPALPAVLPDTTRTDFLGFSFVFGLPFESVALEDALTEMRKAWEKIGGPAVGGPVLDADWEKFFGVSGSLIKPEPPPTQEQRNLMCVWPIGERWGKL